MRPKARKGLKDWGRRHLKRFRPEFRGPSYVQGTLPLEGSPVVRQLQAAMQPQEQLKQ